MRNNFFLGAGFFVKGFFLALSPGLKRFIILPVVINGGVLMGGILLLAHYISLKLKNFLPAYLIHYTGILHTLIWIIFWLSSFLISAFVFTLLTNIIASPFYGLLAEKVELKLNASSFSTGKTPSPWKTTIRTLIREARKLLYFIPWFLISLILFMIPFTLPFAPFIGWLVLSWILAIQYVDYSADNHQVLLKNMIQQLKNKPLTTLGFGAMVTLAMGIPGANLIVPPAAVAGGTALWLSLHNSRN